jgi:hypothetical protein
MLIPSINKTLNELKLLVSQLSNDDYVSPCKSLSNATIGEHTRHIIEMFQCLKNQYDFGVVNYDKRERNICIQTDTTAAIENIILIQKNLDKKNKDIELLQVVDGEEVRIKSNYFRELLYNLEHCIHHQALIKVALLQYESVVIDPDFGVARSTILYRNKCVQ